MMTPECWQQLKALLAPALELPPPARIAYLDRVSAADSPLRLDLERLLAAEERAGTAFLRDPAPFENLAEHPASDRKPLIGLRVGVYEIVEEIGSGGMGEVYRAFRADDQYRKQVAIKLVRAGQDSKTVVQRFKNERQILASLDHPNIARLLDGGTTEGGLPYFVMELIEGFPIDQHCDDHKLSISERLQLFSQVCSAVQYAHQHTIIHRDIKPGNILVTSDGVPKLLDFGIAKILDAAAIGAQLQPTLTIFRALTPGYASPEQLKGATITTASDIYSLGVVLYVLLTGRSPYRLTQHTAEEVTRNVCEVEPEKPNAVVRRAISEDLDCISSADIARSREGSIENLSHRLRGDLDEIVLMALRKEPQRRYASVEQFSQDIRRHLEDLPVLARRDTVRYRTSKFLTRHKAGVAAAAAVFLTLLLGMAVTVREAGIARQQAEVARIQRVRAERRFNDVRNLSNSLLFEIHDSIQNLPGATAARKVLVDRAVQYLDSLAQEAAGDPGLQREVASSYERLGDVQGKPLAASLGDDAAALQSYNRAAMLREELARTNKNADDAISLAKIHRLIANAAVESGDISGALEHAKKAVTVATAISGSTTRSNLAAASELALDYLALGCVESGGGFNSAGLSDPLAALRDFDQALTIVSQLLKSNPDNESLAYENAGLYERIGGLQGMHGRRPEGLQNLNIALSIFRRIGARNGNASRSIQGGVAAIASLIGEIQLMDGRFQPALLNFQEELATYKSFAERDPQDLQARVDLGGAYYDVGDVLVKMGRFKDGLPMIRRAIALDQQLIPIDRKRGVLRSNLAQHLVAEAEALNKIGDAKGALQSYKEARGLYQSLAELDDLNLDARLNVSATHVKIGATYLRLRQVDDAQETYQRAVQVSEPPAGRNPPNLQAQYTLADAYSGLGDVAVYRAVRIKDPVKQLSHRTEAKSWYEKSLRVWRAIPNRSVISPSEFDVGDPEQVRKHLATCKAALDKLKKPAVAPIE
jgi:serine/threonine protein kinase/tetratricopeptide (TPR) repeat protein